MRVSIDELAGARLLDSPVHRDDRGYFTKIVERDGSGSHEQLCSSYNQEAGTVRGLHHQVAPYVETKLVWCVSGSLFDVLVDLRPEQPTYGDWAAVELSEPGAAVVVPPGVAHGYQTLADDTTVIYLIDGDFSAAHARTLRWDDPTVAVAWPRDATVLSQQDRTAPSWPPAS